MFCLLATTKCKRQQIALLIISFFAYVFGIRNEGNNMLLQQQQQQTKIENPNYQSPTSDIKQQLSLNFRPSQIIDFTLADAAIPQKFEPTYMKDQHYTNSNTGIYNSNNNNNNTPRKQETQNVNRRYAIQTATAHGNAAKKQFSFPNEQQQIPQHLTDKPIYIYRDPFTNENYHHLTTETNVKDAATYNHNNYYKQQNSYHQPQHDDNQEYLVQSSMTVGTHQQPQPQLQPSTNPHRPYMSLSYDKEVYLKRPGVVYDEKPGYNQANSVAEKKNEELKINKISYDSHDYPPPSYFQQQTSNFLPTPVPAQPTTPGSAIRSTRPPSSPPRQDFRPPLTTQSNLFFQQRPQQQYLQSSQTMLPNYANSIDNYLLNKQQTSHYYRTEEPPPLYWQQKQQQQSQKQQQYENRPHSIEYDNASRPQSLPPSYEQHQYLSRPPSYNSAQEAFYSQYDTTRPPPGRPSYNNYYDYQIGEIPPQVQTSLPPSQQFNYPYPKLPPHEYTYQRPYRPPPSTHQQQQQQGGLATLAQYAPQFTSLLLGGVGGVGEGSNTNSPLSSLIGALTGAATSQQQSASPTLSSSYSNRRPVNSQLIKALENIARNDDLQCVPKVLCQMIAAQTQRGQLPTFITSPAITNFLAGFPAASPALIYGRALLLGLSGGDNSCHQTYVKCPKTEFEIIDYLNNHRGGFFKFFSEPEEQQQTVNHEATQHSPTSLFSILAALTGTPATTTTTPRPRPKPQAPTKDIASSIGNFFTQLLSDYMGGATVEYQRRFKRRTKRSVDDKIKFEGETVSENYHGDVVKFQDENEETQRDVFKFKDSYYDNMEDSKPDIDEDFHDEEDDEDTQQGVIFKDYEQDYLDDTESRILQKTWGREKRLSFFPQKVKEPQDDELKKIIKQFNDVNRGKRLTFPADTNERRYADASYQVIRQGKKLYNDSTNDGKLNYGHQFNNYTENSYDETKKIKFINNDEGEDTANQAQSLYSYYIKDPKEPNSKVVFPERKGKILNHPYYAASYLQEYLQQEQLQHEIEADQEDNTFKLPNIQRPLLHNEFPATSLAHVYKTHLNSENTFSSNIHNSIYVTSSPPNINSNVKHFLPTPPPEDNVYTSNNLNYLSSKQPNHVTLKQSSNYNPQKYTTATSSLTPSKISSNFYKPSSYTANSQTNYNRYHSSLYTTRRPYASTSVTTANKPDDKNIYVTNSRGVTEYYVAPDGTKVYL